jgi:hypothetical protein
LAILPTGQSRGGVEGLLRHPAVYGGLGALALGIIGDQRKRNSSVQSVHVLGPAQLTANKEDVFVADVLDARGRPSNATVTWQSDNPAIANIDPTSGRVKAGTPGVAIIKVNAGDVVHRFRLEVVPAGSSSK